MLAPLACPLRKNLSEMPGHSYYGLDLCRDWMASGRLVSAELDLPLHDRIRGHAPLSRTLRFDREIRARHTQDFTHRLQRSSSPESNLIARSQSPLLHGGFPLPSFSCPTAAGVREFASSLRQVRCRNHLCAGTGRRRASILIEFAPGEDLVGIHLMATSNTRNCSAGLESLPHYCEPLLHETPAALLRLGQNFNRLYVVTRLKHRQKTTS